MRRSKALVISVLLLAALAPGVALAVADPDTLSIVSARGYGDVLEAGDILLVVHYHVDYNTLPSETARQTVLGRYTDDGGVPRREAAPYVYVRSGYGQGVISIYFSAADASAYSIAHGESATASLIGNPAFFASPWTISTAVTWRTKGSQAVLENDVAAIADVLEQRPEWTGLNLIQTLSGRQVLAATGEDYFENAIANIRRMAPNLFSTSLQSAQFIERQYTLSYQQTLENELAGSRLEHSFRGLAEWLNVPQNVLESVVVLFFGLFLGGTIAAWLVSQGVSESAGVAFTLLTTIVIIILAARIGWFSLQFLGVLAVLSAGLMAYVFFFKRAG